MYLKMKFQTYFSSSCERTRIVCLMGAVLLFVSFFLSPVCFAKMTADDFLFAEKNVHVSKVKLGLQ